MPTITILHVPGCAGGATALEIAGGIAESRTGIMVADVVVNDDSDVLALGFRGSPTVLIDGRDIDPDPGTPLGSMG